MLKESDKTLTRSIKVTRLLPLIKSGSFASNSYRCCNAKQIVLQRPVDDCGSLPRAELSGAPRLLSPAPGRQVLAKVRPAAGLSFGPVSLSVRSFNPRERKLPGPYS